MFDLRIQRIREILDKNKVEGVLISSVSNIIYLTGYANFSKEEREAYLIITKRNQFILTDARYTEAIRKEVKHFKLIEISARVGFEKIITKLKREIKSIGIEESNLTVSEYKIIKKYFKNIKNVHIQLSRSQKTKEEIELIKKASDLGDKAFKFILKKIKVGVTEKQIAHELESFIRNEGAQTSFPSIVAFDKNSSVPHHQTGNTRLDKKSGQFILLDFGVKIENYCSDMTRTIFFGSPDNKKKNIYKTVLESQEKAVEFITKCLIQKRSIRTSDVDKLSRSYIKLRKYPSIPHSLGHGIGLQVHERPSLSPKSKESLKEGMVFSIEPGIYLEEFGGVRIEDLYFIEKGEIKQLTNSPKDLTVI